MCVPKVRLLVLLAALVPGRVDAGLECDINGILYDPSKCRAADIMRAFGGRGLQCDSDNVRRKGGCCRAERPAHLQGRAAGAVPARIQREGCPRTARLALAFNTFSFLLYTPFIAIGLNYTNYSFSDALKHARMQALGAGNDASACKAIARSINAHSDYTGPTISCVSETVPSLLPPPSLPPKLAMTCSPYRLGIALCTRLIMSHGFTDVAE